MSLTSSTGGAKGTGVIDIRNLSLPVNSQLLIQFDVTLASALSNGSVVINQSDLRRADDTLVALSDDPNSTVRPIPSSRATRIPRGCKSPPPRRSACRRFLRT